MRAVPCLPACQVSYTLTPLLRINKMQLGGCLRDRDCIWVPQMTESLTHKTDRASYGQESFLSCWTSKICSKMSCIRRFLSSPVFPLVQPVVDRMPVFEIITQHHVTNVISTWGMGVCFVLRSSVLNVFFYLLKVCSDSAQRCRLAHLCRL